MTPFTCNENALLIIYFEFHQIPKRTRGRKEETRKCIKQGGKKETKIRKQPLRRLEYNATADALSEHDYMLP
jgi:hypothetical protein